MAWWGLHRSRSLSSVRTDCVHKIHNSYTLCGICASDRCTPALPNGCLNTQIQIVKAISSYRFCQEKYKDISKNLWKLCGTEILISCHKLNLIFFSRFNWILSMKLQTILNPKPYVFSFFQLPVFFNGSRTPLVLLDANISLWKDFTIIFKFQFESQHQYKD